MTLRIAEVFEQTGVPASTLRYYEQIGLLVPAASRGVAISIDEPSGPP